MSGKSTSSPTASVYDPLDPFVYISEGKEAIGDLPVQNPMSNEWWKSGNFPVLNYGYVRANWLDQALCQYALFNKQGTATGCYESGQFIGDFDVLVKDIDALNGHCLWNSDYTGKNGDRYYNRLYVFEQGYLEATFDTKNLNVALNAGSLNPAFIDGIKALYAKNGKEKASNGQVYVVVQTQGGPQLKSIGMAAVPLERGNYDPETLAEYDHIVDDLKSATPCGRISILEGIMGSGKTFMVRSLLAAVPDAVFVMLQPEMVPVLASPEFIGTLIDERDSRDTPTVFIVEDADDCLVHRSEGNMRSLTTLLNLTDGIFGSLLNLRIVATTNAGHLEREEQLDPALLRDGRLCKKIHVGALSPERAAEVYKSLTGDDIVFGAPLTVSEVYKSAKTKVVKPTKKPKRMGFGG